MHPTLEKLQELFEETPTLKDEFKYLLWEEFYKTKDFHGIEPEFVSCGRTSGSGDYDGYEWIFKLDGDLFKVYGSYASWVGTEMDFSGVSDIYPCKLVERIITEYENI